MKLPLDPPKHLQNFRCASLRRGCFAPQRRPYPGRHYHPRHFRKRSRCPGRAGLPASAFRCTTLSLFEICASHPSRTHWKIGAARSPNFPVSFGRNRALDTQLRIKRRAVLANCSKYTFTLPPHLRASRCPARSCRTCLRPMRGFRKRPSPRPRRRLLCQTLRRNNLQPS